MGANPSECSTSLGDCEISHGVLWSGDARTDGHAFAPGFSARNVNVMDAKSAGNGHEISRKPPPPNVRSVEGAEGLGKATGR